MRPLKKPKQKTSQRTRRVSIANIASKISQHIPVAMANLRSKPKPSKRTKPKPSQRIPVPMANLDSKSRRATRKRRLSASRNWSKILGSKI
jgi:hypothetical protein